MTGPAFPSEMLDGIAAAPDDVAAWQVLSDWMLEVGHPHATLARCELELLRGISDGELLGDFAAARQALLPRMEALGRGLTWRAGLVLRATVQPAWALEQLQAPEFAALHELRVAPQPGALESGLAAELARLLVAAPPRLRRLSYESAAPRLREGTLDALLSALRARPRDAQTLRLCLGREAAPHVTEALPALAAAGWRRLLLEGTVVPPRAVPRLVQVLDTLPSDFRLVAAGTGLGPAALPHRAVEWLEPEVKAWWVHVESGALVPLRPEGLVRAAAFPPELRAQRSAGTWRRDFDGSELEPGEEVATEGGAWRFQVR